MLHVICIFSGHPVFLFMYNVFLLKNSLRSFPAGRFVWTRDICKKVFWSRFYDGMIPQRNRKVPGYEIYLILERTHTTSRQEVYIGTFWALNVAKMSHMNEICDQFRHRGYYTRNEMWWDKKNSSHLFVTFSHKKHQHIHVDLFPTCIKSDFDLYHNKEGVRILLWESNLSQFDKLFVWSFILAKVTLRSLVFY